MPEAFTAWGFHEDKRTHNGQTWQGEYLSEEDSLGRALPDWLPLNVTTLQPPSATSKFIEGVWK